MIPLFCLPQFYLCPVKTRVGSDAYNFTSLHLLLSSTGLKNGWKKQGSTNSRGYYHVAFMASRSAFVYFPLCWQMLVISQCGSTVVEVVFTEFSLGTCEPMIMMRPLWSRTGPDLVQNWILAPFIQWRWTLPSGNEQPLNRAERLPVFCGGRSSNSNIFAVVLNWRAQIAEPNILDIFYDNLHADFLSQPLPQCTVVHS